MDSIAIFATAWGFEIFVKPCSDGCQFVWISLPDNERAQKNFLNSFICITFCIQTKGLINIIGTFLVCKFASPMSSFSSGGRDGCRPYEFDLSCGVPCSPGTFRKSEVRVVFRIYGTRELMKRIVSLMLIAKRRSTWENNWWKNQ